MIIPVYNVEPYLNRCLCSLINQTYKNIEVIIIDDGSKDNSLSICYSYENKDKRVTVIHTENHGVSSARNLGISKATGEWIAFVDPDDYIELNMIEELVGHIGENQLVCCGYYLHSINGEIKTVDNYYSKFTSNNLENCDNLYALKRMIGLSDDDIYRWNRGGSLYENRAQGMVWQYLFNADIIHKNHITFDENLIFKEDEIFCCEYLVYVHDLFVVNKPLYHYVMRDSSLCNTINKSVAMYDKKLKNKLHLIRAKDKINKRVKTLYDIDLLSCYAGSNVLSITELMVLVVYTKQSYKYVKEYCAIPSTKKSIKMIKLSFKNIKFNFMLFLLKIKFYRGVFVMIKICSMLGVSFKKYIG